ncbi:2-oxo acid dehydrogenase subunit E2 [Anatilimnocola floriformis]|uniref:2-oxo acid dehydrogenase subunit E2 n=1 Tax=Anatilimnocola floriformis TaxID=2948575 RepID=UPI0020C53AD9|nr:2-oxo acid dehydrogenase subunit E2 [Anatilimnocola floriformis]
MSRLLNRKVPCVAGKKISLSLPRRFMGDVLHFARRIPSVPMQRRMRLADVIAARAQSARRVSWCAIFMKAWCLVAAQRPELRRTFLTFPTGHLYEHPINVASFSLERTWQGEEGVFVARVPQPELISLSVLNQMVRAHKSAPIEQVDSFRQGLWISSLPLPLRRLMWWTALETTGRWKSYYFGTFAISVVASLGAAGLHVLSPLAMTLNYGTFEADGSLDVRLAYDHRVIDGATAARALDAVEGVLHQEIREELLAIAQPGERREPRQSRKIDHSGRRRPIDPIRCVDASKPH